MKLDHIHCPIRPRVSLDNPQEPLEMIGFTIARYKFACKWLRQTDRVMEVGCGDGFGCHFFAQHVQQVTGIDIDEQLIGQCAARYPQENLQFVARDILAAFEPPSGPFDAVVSFEMIEHVSHAEGRRVVANCAAHLKDRGLFIMSTPRAREDRSVSRQHMHVFEYDYETLLETLSPHFHRVMVFCQNDEYIYAGHPSTAWNFVALGFR